MSEESLLVKNNKAICVNSKLLSINGSTPPVPPVTTNWYTDVYESADKSPGFLVHFDTTTVLRTFAYINTDNTQAKSSSHIVFHLIDFETKRQQTGNVQFEWENILSTDDATIVITECSFKDVDGNTLYRHDVTLNNTLTCEAGEWYLFPIFKNEWTSNYVSYNDESTHPIFKFPTWAIQVSSWWGVPPERLDTVCYLELNGEVQAT